MTTINRQGVLTSGPHRPRANKHQTPNATSRNTNKREHTVLGQRAERMPQLQTLFHNHDDSIIWHQLMSGMTIEEADQLRTRRCNDGRPGPRVRLWVDVMHLCAGGQGLKPLHRCRRRRVARPVPRRRGWRKLRRRRRKVVVGSRRGGRRGSRGRLLLALLPFVLEGVERVLAPSFRSMQLPLSWLLLVMLLRLLSRLDMLLLLLLLLLLMAMW